MIPEIQFAALVSVLLPRAQALQPSITSGGLARELRLMFAGQSLNRAANFGFDVLRVRYEFERMPLNWTYQRRVEMALLWCYKNEVRS